MWRSCEPQGVLDQVLPSVDIHPIDSGKSFVLGTVVIVLVIFSPSNLRSRNRKNMGIVSNEKSTILHFDAGAETDPLEDVVGGKLGAVALTTYVRGLIRRRETGGFRLLHPLTCSISTQL
ncbi:hypothetical protein L227DRAFT_247657 [Lentinus tigrinus ALCF2SS1-6]|uniref:Uncharacterized protein n=1 Tax=Lentinus tigrinus ALCF2SS1-6 TaxID=1328759 RepID=A0A5C2RZY6_9APHY|nr:hypothetical protein L227DRAFT_247657 [Lentinus tigrinus ALCF2SS1-6]